MAREGSQGVVPSNIADEVRDGRGAALAADLGVVQTAPRQSGRSSVHVYSNQESRAGHRVLMMRVHLALRKKVPLAWLHLPEIGQ